MAIFDLLASARPSQIEVLFDQQLSGSGELAALVRKMMCDHDLSGTARTAKDVDHLLKESNFVVATSDGPVIDAVAHVVDIPHIIAKERGITPIII